MMANSYEQTHTLITDIAQRLISGSLDCRKGSLAEQIATEVTELLVPINCIKYEPSGHGYCRVCKIGQNAHV